MFGPKREEVRRLEKTIMSSFMVCVDLQVLLGDKMEEYELGVACGVYRLEPEGRRPLLWQKWEDSIKMDHKLIARGVRKLY
jgi:hypothetical protein